MNFSVRRFDKGDAHARGRPAARQEDGWAFIRTFCELKFISLFSLLFGMGLVVQVTRAKTKGRSFTMYYLRRTAILAIFGLAHGLLLWYGDILFLYACASRRITT